MTIALFIPIHGRQHITAVCFAGVQRLRSQFAKRDVDLIPFIIYSDESDKSIAHALGGAVCIKAPNRPLGRKLNMGLDIAMQYEWDYFMQLGSDDLISRYAVDLIHDSMLKSQPFFGFTSLALYDIETGRSKAHKDGISVFGAGRCVRRDVLLKASDAVLVRFKHSFSGPSGRGGKGEERWIPRANVNAHCIVLDEGVKVWQDDRNSALDADSERRIEAAAKVYVRNIEAGINSDTAYVLDIKSGENIHDYDSIKGKDVHLSVLIDHFPEIEMLLG